MKHNQKYHLENHTMMLFMISAMMVKKSQINIWILHKYLGVFLSQYNQKKVNTLLDAIISLIECSYLKNGIWEMTDFKFFKGWTRGHEHTDSYINNNNVFNNMGKTFTEKNLYFKANKTGG